MTPASNGGTEFPLEERFNALCEILGEIEREGCEPWSVNATTALCHARTLAEDILPPPYDTTGPSTWETVMPDGSL